MALKSIDVKPGLNRESTQSSNDGYWFDANNVRWKTTKTETIGGWVASAAPSMRGIVRALHTWKDFSDSLFTAVGTTFKLYISVDEENYDITPNRLAAVVVAGPISTDGTTNEVTITHANHGASVNDFVVFKSIAAAGPFGGISSASFTNEIEGFQIFEIVDDDNYKIKSTETSTSMVTGQGGNVTFDYKIRSGVPGGVAGSGWGVGSWGGDDYIPDLLSFATPDPVSTVGAGDSTLVLNVTGHTGVAFAAGDYIYPIGLTGSIDGVDLNYLNNKWWYIANLNGGSPNTPEIELGFNATGGPNSGGGALRTFYHYSSTPTPMVEGATRGWGEPSTDSVDVSMLRSVTIENFGEDLMFSIRGGPIYYYDVSAKTSSGIPEQGEVAVDIGDISGASETPVVCDSFLIAEGHGHCIALGCNDVLATDQNKMLIRWSDRHNPFEWLPTPSNEAGGTVIRNGSELVAGVQTKDDIVIFSNSAVYSMRYVGYPDVYIADLVTENVSLYSKNGAVSVDNSVFFMGNEEFYVYNGSVSVLPKMLTSYVFDDINIDQKEKIHCGVNSKFSEVIWFYPSGNSFECDRWVSYNYSNGTWGTGNYDMTSLSQSAGSSTSYNRTAWEGVSIFDNPIAGYIKTYDPGAEPVSELSGLMVHEIGTNAQGQSINSFAESGEVDISDGEEYVYYSRIIPDVEIFNQSVTALMPAVTISLQGRNLPGRIQGPAKSVELDFSNQSDTELTYAPNYQRTSIRGRSRFVSIRVENTDSGYGWRLGTPRIDAEPDGGGR